MRYAQEGVEDVSPLVVVGALGVVGVVAFGWFSFWVGYVGMYYAYVVVSCG